MLKQAALKLLHVFGIDMFQDYIESGKVKHAETSNAQKMIEDAEKLLKKCESEKISIHNATSMFIELLDVIVIGTRASMNSKGYDSTDHEALEAFLRDNESTDMRNAADYIQRYAAFVNMHKAHNAPITPHLTRESQKFARKYIPLVKRNILAG